VNTNASAPRPGRSKSSATQELQQRTIADFGRQWTSYPSAEGYFGSVELFNDTFSPLLSEGDIAGRRVAEIGAG
jgi:hypothetical protein